MNKRKLLFDNRKEITKKIAEANHDNPEDDLYFLNDHGFFFCDIKENASGFRFRFIAYRIDYSQKNFHAKINNKSILIFENSSVKFSSVDAFYNLSSSLETHVIQDAALVLLFNYLNIDWFHVNLFPLLSIEQLRQIIEGEITTPITFLQSFISEYDATCSMRKLYKAILTYEMKPNEFDSIVDTALNIDHALDLWIRLNGFNYSPEISNLIALSALYNKKINFSWSDKRMMEEHNKLVREFNHFYAPIKISGSVPNLENIPELPEYFTILDTGEAICRESEVMNHCLAAVYGEQIMGNYYLAFHVNYQDEEATLGVNWTENRIEFDQLSGKHNKAVSKPMQVFCMKWVTENAKMFIKQKCKWEPLFELVDEEYIEPPF